MRPSPYFAHGRASKVCVAWAVWTWKTCTLEYLGVGNLVAPAGATDGVEAPRVESVQFPLLFRIGRPCFAAIEEGTDYARIVYCHLSNFPDAGCEASWVVAALPMRLLISVSSDRLSLMVYSRYGNSCTTSSWWSSMQIAGGVCRSWLSTLVFLSWLLVWSHYKPGKTCQWGVGVIARCARWQQHHQHKACPWWFS